MRRRLRLSRRAWHRGRSRARSRCATGFIATLYDWRRQFRSAAVADAGFVASDFVPVVAENQGGSATAAIEIEIGGATLRVGAGVELGFLGKVLRLLKAMK
jgi:hypothetical protein